ncbi:hypothetical protein BpHYR1_013530, partial [Brachionus plicatilis]
VERLQDRDYQFEFVNELEVGLVALAARLQTEVRAELVEFFDQRVVLGRRYAPVEVAGAQGAQNVGDGVHGVASQVAVQTVIDQFPSGWLSRWVRERGFSFRAKLICWTESTRPNCSMWCLWCLRAPNLSMNWSNRPMKCTERLRVGTRGDWCEQALTIELNNGPLWHKYSMGPKLWPLNALGRKKSAINFSVRQLNKVSFEFLLENVGSTGNINAVECRPLLTRRHTWPAPNPTGPNCCTSSLIWSNFG